MTHEQAVQAKKAVGVVAGFGVSWGLQDLSLIVSICVGISVFIYTMTQFAFLVRRWYRLEKTDWKNEKET
jgi:phage shock protein PspC (stress-responsive transcriptional regulator)